MIKVAMVGLGRWGQTILNSIQGKSDRLHIVHGVSKEPELVGELAARHGFPLSSDLEDAILEIWRQYSQTILLVTHDIEEAIYLADRVLVLSGRPSEIREEMRIDLERPRNQLKTKEEKQFIEYRRHIYTLIREENKKCD